jgi:hypothetical protein
MFSQVWRKYLPVIAILMKRSVQEAQLLSMNNTDFKSVLGGKKVKVSFTTIIIDNGRLQDAYAHSAIAKEFVIVLQEYDAIAKLMAGQQFEFSMNNNFQLAIKYTTVSSASTTGDAAEDADNDPGVEAVSETH